MRSRPILAQSSIGSTAPPHAPLATRHSEFPLTRDSLRLRESPIGTRKFLVLALSVLPGLVVYPAIAAGEVGLMAVAGVVLWKEKVGVRSWLGIALAILALVLIQLGKVAGT